MVAVWLLLFIYIAAIISTRHLITWADLTPSVTWHLLGCLVILVLFPLIFLPVMNAFREAHPRPGAESLFYREWASAFAGTGKGGAGRILFFAEEVERFHIDQAKFRDAPVYVVTVSFRRKYFFRRGKARFVIREERDLVPGKMIVWARDRGIEVEQLPEGIRGRV